MSLNFNFLFPFLLFLLLQPCFIQATQKSSQDDSTVKVVCSIVIILGIFLIGLIFLCICYRTTKKLDNVAGKIRGDLAKEYQNALNLQIEKAIKVNTYLLKSLAPEKPLMGKSMLKSSWRKNNSPTKIKGSQVPAPSKFMNLNKVEMSVNGNNKNNI